MYTTECVQILKKHSEFCVIYRVDLEFELDIDILRKHSANSVICAKIIEKCCFHDFFDFFMEKCFGGSHLQYQIREIPTYTFKMRFPEIFFHEKVERKK